MLARMCRCVIVAAMAVRIVIYALLVASVAIVIIPFPWMSSTSLEDESDLFAFPLEWIQRRSADMRTWGDYREILTPREGCYDALKLGTGGPPIETDEVWLMIYHGVDHARVYRLGVAMLDKDGSTKVIHRSKPAARTGRFGGSRARATRAPYPGILSLGVVA